LRKRISGQYLAIHYRPSQLATARLGLVVGKKIAKRSVDRNYMRRVLRELFRKQQAEIGQFDLVVRVIKVFGHTDFERLEQEFSELLFRLKRATAKQAGSGRTKPDHV